MSLNTTPRTWVSGENVTAAIMNTEVRDALTGIQAAATTYTVTTTGFTLGNGTKAGRYSQIGHWVDFTITLTLGSTSAITGSVTLTLPPVTALNSNWMSEDCDAFDSSAGAWYSLGAIATSTTVVTVRSLSTTAASNLIVLSATVPFTWATSDQLIVTGRYESA